MDIGKHLSLAGSDFKSLQDYLRDIDADISALYILSQGHISSSNIGDESLQSWQSTLTFSSTDEDTVTWTTGSLVFSNGATYTISTGNTGNMTALTYIYFDKGASTTALQTSTTATNAIGDNKVLMAIAQNNTGYDATFQVFNGSGGMVITTTNVATGTITANEIRANTITSNEIAALAIITEKLAAEAVTADKIGANAITTVKIEASAVTAQEIAADTIQATHLHSNSVYTDAIQASAVTAEKVAANAIAASNIQADAVNASHINVSELSAISSSMGTIVSGLITAATVRTAATGTRVVMDTNGLVGYDSVLGQVFKIPTDGTPPSFSAGVIRNATVYDTAIYSDSIYSSSTLPYIEFTSNGIGYREATAGGLYNTFLYGGGTTYGTGLAARLFNVGEPILNIQKERDYSDIHLYNRTGHSAGASTVGDIEVVSANLYLCTTGGTPGTFSILYMAGGTDVAVADGGTGKSSWTQYLIPYADTTTSLSQIAIGSSGDVLTSNGAGAAPSFQAVSGGASTALDNLASVAINTALLSDTDATDDLGSNTKQWKDLYLSGQVYGDSLADQFSYMCAGDFLEIDPDMVLLLGWLTPATTEQDLSPHNHDATYQGTMTTGDQLHKGLVWSLDFDGTDDYIDFGDHNDFSFGNSTTDSPFSIGGWIEVSAALQVIMAKYDLTTGSTAREYQFVIYASRIIQLSIYDESAVAACNRDTDAAISVGWHFIVATYDGTGGATAANGITIYIDGVAIASTASNNANYVAMENLTSSLLVGGRWNSGVVSLPFQGDMGHIFLTPGVLTADEIWQMYIKTRGYYGL